MAPTGCFEDSVVAGSIPIISSCTTGSATEVVPGQHRHRGGLLKATRSPLHHGTDPDLSASNPIPGGVACTGLDLSPVDIGSCGLQAIMAKRKQRGIPSPKAAGQHHHHYNQLKSWRPEQAAARDFSAPQQTKLTAQYAAAFVRSDGVDSLSGGFSTLPRPRDGHLQETEQRDRSNSKEPGAAAQGTLGWCPPLGKLQQQERQPSHPSVATAAAAAGSTALSDGESNNNGDDDGDDSGSTKAKVAGSTRERSGLGRDNQGLKVMMVKAKLASDNIRLLLHAKRCEGTGCKEPGCESARELVQHIRACHLAGAVGCNNVKCLQAQKLLQHYSECNRRRTFGGRCCLVCSLVARSASSNANKTHLPTHLPHHSQSNSNVSSVGLNSAMQRRQPLGYLGPAACGSAPRRRSSPNTNASCMLRGNPLGRVAPGVVTLQAPIGITRLKRGASAGEQAPAPVAAIAVSLGSKNAFTGGVRASPVGSFRGASAGFVVGMRHYKRDGGFYRPLSKARSGSWGGYDRRRCLRRSRFDSIPEELAEEEEDELDQETASKEGAKGSDDAPPSRPNKTLVTSLSL